MKCESRDYISTYKCSTLSSHNTSPVSLITRGARQTSISCVSETSEDVLDHTILQLVAVGCYTHVSALAGLGLSLVLSVGQPAH